MKKEGQLTVFCGGKVLALFILLADIMRPANADPVFRCKDKRTGAIRDRDFNGYKSCARDCSC